MGQYYIPTNISKIQHVYSHDYEAGMKLMEHSWIGNDFVGTVMKLMMPGNPWHKDRLVWAGDYGEKKLGDFPDSDAVKDVINKLQSDSNIFNLAEDNNKLKPTEKLTDEEWSKAVLVNYTRKQYVIVDKAGAEEADGDWRICQLPLLCSDGNGNGGGDYHGNNEDLCGLWCGDSIGVELCIPDGFEELIPEFKED